MYTTFRIESTDFFFEAPRDSWKELEELTRRTPSARHAAIGSDLLLALLRKHHGRDPKARGVAATAEPGGDL